MLACYSPVQLIDGNGNITTVLGPAPIDLRSKPDRICLSENLGVRFTGLMAKVVYYYVNNHDMSHRIKKETVAFSVKNHRGHLRPEQRKT